MAALANMVLAHAPPRYLFLVGVAPALLVLWIRSAVPEPEEWHAAKLNAKSAEPRVRDLFRGEVLPITLLTTAVCAISLTAHWAFMFWSTQHMQQLPDVINLAPEERRML